MPKLYEQNQLSAKGRLIPADRFVPFAGTSFDKNNISFPQTVPEAEKYLGKPVPNCPASVYMEYYRNGNRSRYEALYFARRAAMMNLLMAELTEKQGRFTDTLIDYIWAVCEESTWVIPAHNTACHGNPKNCLPDQFNQNDGDDVRCCDLFAAATAGMLALVWYLGEDILDGVTPVIRRRILDMLKNRIFHVYCDVRGEGNWWMGDKGEVLNNWTPWIVSNVMTAVMLCETDDEKRELAAERSMLLLDRFTSTYPIDGGCDEGPGYWGVAGASYFDCIEILSDMTGGALDLYGDPFVVKMCEYIVDFNLGGRVFVNFADAGHLLTPDMALLARAGRKCGSDKLTAYARANYDKRNYSVWSHGNTPYRAMLNAYEPEPARVTMDGKNEIFYPGLEVMITKNPETGLALAVKGGNNGESHNHNDVGSFVLFKNGEPVFLDAGVETYSKDTFSSKRYTLWTMRSLYHNLPALNGYEQKPGRQYHAEILSAENGVMEMELKNAYPAECGVESYVRRVYLRGTGAVIEDRIRYAGEGDAVFSLMCPAMPAFEGNTMKITGCTAEFDASLTAETDEIALEDKLRKEWSTDHLVRVRLASETFTDKTFTLTITAD